MSRPPNIGEPIRTANVMIIPKTIPTIMNLFFLMKDSSKTKIKRK